MNASDDLNPAMSAIRQIEQVKQQTTGFLQAARTGSFGVSERAGKAMIDAINQCRDGLDGMQNELDRIAQDTMLGTSPDAQVMIAFNKEVAAGPSNSATAYIESLRTAFDELIEGITEAMKHYRRADEDSASGINRAGA